MDSYSKWVEVFAMKKCTASEVIQKLRQVFGTFGLPCEMVSDNGPPFKSKTLKLFCEVNKIKCPDIPTYHPQSNGSAERMVGTVKKALKKCYMDPRNRTLDIETIL